MTTSVNVKVEDPNRIDVIDVETTKTSYKLGIDEVVEMPIKFSPVDATNAQFEWISSNSEIIRVWNDQKVGRIRALKEGTAELIIKTLDGRFEKRISVTVEDLNKQWVESVDIEDEYTIEINDVLEKQIKFEPVAACNAEFDWIAVNSEIVRVWNNQKVGRIRALKEGTTEVIIKTRDEKFEKRVKITVVSSEQKNNDVQDVIIQQEQYKVGINSVLEIPIKYTPIDAINAEFDWIAVNPEIIRVWNDQKVGRFRGLKAGTTEVIVKTRDGKFEKRFKVEVQDTQINEIAYEIGKDEVIEIPIQANENEEIVWITTEPNILRVWNDQKVGRFRGLNTGTTEITIKTADGTEKTKFKVTVK